MLRRFALFSPPVALHTACWLLLLSVVVVGVVSNLVGYGMFMDGLLYNAVAHNSAQGLGSFWFPFYTPSAMPFFHEQPPLTFFIESLFFRVFGSGLWVERLYTLTTLLLGGALLRLIWREALPQHAQFAWLPLLFWLLIPCVMWSYSNCMEENTMSVFVLTAVLLQIRVLSQKIGAVGQVFAGFALVLGSLCKGFPALFPLGLMGFAWLSGKTDFKKATLHTALIGVTIAVCYFLLYLYPPSRESLGTYLSERVFNSIKNVSTNQGRFWLAQHLFEQLLLVLALAAILCFAHLKINKEKLDFALPNSLLFLLLGLSGSLPLLVTAEQRAFYLTTSMPYFALALGAATVSAVRRFWGRLSANELTTLNPFQTSSILFSLLVLTCALIFAATKVGGYHRDADKWHDIFLFEKALPRNAVVGVYPLLWDDFELRCGLNRLVNTDCKTGDIQHVEFFINDKTLQKMTLDSLFTRINLPTQRYDLYRRRQ